MGLKGKLVGEIEINSSAENFHHQFRYKPHQVSDFCPLVQDCKLHEGEFGQNGATLIWRYKTPDGKLYSAKQVFDFHEETKTMKCAVIEGDVMVDCKSFAITLESISREGQNDVLRWTIDYERINEDSPHPVESLNVLLNISMYIEIEHLNKPYVP